MLRDYRARSLTYDAATDVARLEVEGVAPGGPTRSISALLLLDSKGFLVGVDLGGDDLERAVVLLGPYEAVARTVAAEVTVAYGDSGEPAEVRVRDAKGAVRGGPYT
jgi:hypothetical protein